MRLLLRRLQSVALLCLKPVRVPPTRLLPVPPMQHGVLSLSAPVLRVRVEVQEALGGQAVPEAREDPGDLPVLPAAVPHCPPVHAGRCTPPVLFLVVLAVVPVVPVVPVVQAVVLAFRHVLVSEHVPAWVHAPAWVAARAACCPRPKALQQRTGRHETPVGQAVAPHVMRRTRK